MLWANNILIKMENKSARLSSPEWLQLLYPYPVVWESSGWSTCGSPHSVWPAFKFRLSPQPVGSGWHPVEVGRLVTTPCPALSEPRSPARQSDSLSPTAPPGKPVRWCICIIFFIKRLLSLCLKSHMDFITFCSKITFFLYEWCIKSCTYLMYECHEFWGEYMSVKPSCQSM